MSSCKILYVCQEIAPYTPGSDIATMCRTLSQSMQERGDEIRTFMPRYGSINERRNQLHEVIRLSGMNLIIDDVDHQLIIKVASIPSARVQIYFIDNDDFFSRKAMLRDDAGALFADDDERAIFFARGVLETVRKLRWSPDIVHCHGWFSAVVPIYLRHVFADDPLFRDVRVVVSLYDDGFRGQLDAGFAQKMVNEGVGAADLEIVAAPTYENLMRLVIRETDGVIVETPTPDAALMSYIGDTGKRVLEYQPREGSEYLDKYQTFYESIL